MFGCTFNAGSGLYIQYGGSGCTFNTGVLAVHSIRVWLVHSMQGFFWLYIQDGVWLYIQCRGLAVHSIRGVWLYIQYGVWLYIHDVGLTAHSRRVWVVHSRQSGLHIQYGEVWLYIQCRGGWVHSRQGLAVHSRRGVGCTFTTWSGLHIRRGLAAHSAIRGLAVHLLSTTILFQFHRCDLTDQDTLWEASGPDLIRSGCIESQRSGGLIMSADARKNIITPEQIDEYELYVHSCCSVVLVMQL